MKIPEDQTDPTLIEKAKSLFGVTFTDHAGTEHTAFDHRIPRFCRIEGTRYLPTPKLTHENLHRPIPQSCIGVKHETQ